DFLHALFKAEIGHQRTHDTIDLPMSHAVADDDVEQFIAVIETAGRVHHLKAVGVAVKRDSEVGAVLADFFNKVVGMRRTYALIDVEAIGSATDFDHFRTQFTEYVGRYVISSPVGGIHHDGQARQSKFVGE